MTENGRYIPAGEGRLAAAFRRGIFPRSRKIAGGVVLLAAGGLAQWAGPSLVQFALGTTRRALHEARSSLEMQAFLRETTTTTLGWLMAFLSVVLVVSLLATVVPALAFAKRRGRTTVPLPQGLARSGGGQLVGWLGAGVFGLIAVRVFDDMRPALTRGMLGDPGALEAIGAALVQLVVAGGAVLVLAGLIETALMRLQILQGLMLNRSEARQEERALRGSPLAKRWMGRSRRG